MATTQRDAKRVHTTDQVPQWDLADRLRKSLRFADITVNDMAEQMARSRNSVTAWINGRTQPSKIVLKVWALKTGVSYEWLVEGSPDIPEEYAVERQMRLMMETLYAPAQHSTRGNRRKNHQGAPQFLRTVECTDRGASVPTPSDVPAWGNHSGGVSTESNDSKHVDVMTDPGFPFPPDVVCSNPHQPGSGAGRGFIQEAGQSQ